MVHTSFPDKNCDKRMPCAWLPAHRFPSLAVFGTIMASIASVLDDLAHSACASDLGGADFAQAARELGQDGPIRAELVSHRGIIALDKLGPGAHVVTNLAITEKKALPTGHSWSIEYDDEDFAICVADDGREPVWVESLMDYEVYKTERHGFAVIASSNTSMNGQMVLLRNFMAKHTEATATLKVGCAKTVQEFDIFVLRWPRTPACKVLWSAKSVYLRLGFSQFSGQPWRWWASKASFPRWSQDMQRLGFPGHVVRSAGMAEVGDSGRGSMIWRQSGVKFGHVSSNGYCTSPHIEHVVFGSGSGGGRRGHGRVFRDPWLGQS